MSTQLSAQDQLHLTRALALACAAVGLASPNPTVGCVLTDAAGNVLGEGAHHYDDRDHAEIAALKQAAARGRSVAGATAYVTLEPCAHHGRTGPCADALIAAGIVRCVVATADPNVLVGGQGNRRMLAAGIAVTVVEGPLSLQAQRLNDAFAHFIQHRRPFVTLKAALSVDGKLAPPASARSAMTPHWITGGLARADVQALRHEADAVLTGIGTMLADDPSLTDRTGLPRRRPLLRVVLDSRLRIPLACKLVASAAHDLLVVCAEDASVAAERALQQRGVEVFRIAASGGQLGGQLDPAAVLRQLAGRQVLSVLVEAGSALNAALLRAELVDKLVLYYAETELGAGALPFATGFASPYVVQQRLTAVARAAFASDVAPGAEDIRISGYLHDPWAAMASGVRSGKIIQGL